MQHIHTLVLSQHNNDTFKKNFNTNNFGIIHFMNNQNKITHNFPHIIQASSLHVHWFNHADEWSQEFGESADTNRNKSKKLE